MPGAQSLAEDIADESELPLGHYKEHTFPDRETLFRILDPVDGAHIYLVAHLDNPDPKTLQLLMLTEGFRQQGAANVTLVAPYLPYMRQDTAFNDGEVVSARAFAKLVSASFDHLITIDPHLHRYQRLDELYDITSDVVSAALPMACWIAQNASTPIVIGPDIESEQWVRQIAGALKAPCDTLRKTRKGDDDVQIASSHLDIGAARSIVLVDDIISSGATMLRTIESIRRDFQDRDIFCAAVHCLASSETLDQFKAAGLSAIAATDSVHSPISDISIARILAQTICSDSSI